MAWLVFGSTIACGVVVLAYTHVGWKNIRTCYKLWFTAKYWTAYNTVEAISWLTKAIIIVPGLVFGVQVWWLYIIALCTSISLIWASNRKLLPTLVGFNSLWVWISCVALSKHFLL